MYGGDIDFFTMKGIAEALLDKAGVYGWDIEASSEPFGYHPGRCAVLTIGGEELGVLGEIHPECAKNYGIAGRVYAMSLDADVMYKTRSLLRAISRCRNTRPLQGISPLSVMKTSLC